MLPIGFDSQNRDDKNIPSFDITTSGGTYRASAEDDERKKLALDFNATGTGNPHAGASVWLSPQPNS